MVQLLWKMAWWFFKKLELSHDSATPFIGKYPKELKTGIQSKTYRKMCIAVIFTVAKKVEKTEMSINSCTDKPNVGYP